MNILHATTEPDLLTRLKEMLAGSARADIAVGFFFMSGFGAVADDLGHLKKVRILVGRTDRHVLEELALGMQQADALKSKIQRDSSVQKSERGQSAQQTVGKIADGISVLRQTDDSISAVQKLRDMVARRQVEVKTYLRSALHAKAYLCWYEDHPEPGAAVVGSSNFTLAGFTGNTELNVRVTGDAEMAELGRWFEELWMDSVDISDDLVKELNRSWAIAKTPPYHVYLKALHELYHEEIGAPALPLTQSRSINLANFQIDAVSRGLSMIDAHGGCYIGDVVGLGKTFVGAELLRQLKQSYPLDGHPLILCPAGLKPMWQRVNELFGLGAEVVSHSMIAPPPGVEFDEDSKQYVDSESSGRGILLEDAYPNRGAVLVDEAHNFRNLNNRSRGLQSYLDAGNHKVVLLSATPQNLGPKDIYRQLRLFLDEEHHGLNIDPIQLSDFFNNAEKWHQYRVDLENREAWIRNGSIGPELEKPQELSIPRAEIGEVLMPVFIRRRRKDIKELYGDTATLNGEPINFPEPLLDNIRYRLDRVYEKAGPFEELQQSLRKHEGARYRATEYIKPKVQHKEEYRDLFRARNRIANLMRVLLLKRLESSIEAFSSTLTSLIRSNRNFKKSLQSGFVPIGDTATRLLAGEYFHADEVRKLLEEEENQRREDGSKKSKLLHSVDDFYVDEWIKDLDVDYELLKEILERVSDIGPDDDDKLQSLKRFLDLPEVKSGKVLIFSEAETTVEYLYRELNPVGADPEIVRLTGATRNRAENIVKRFSPTWNLGKNETMPGDPIRVLLATDIVSEGQNLQDCARVLNYDLHWNPIKLVQRFGRVDRIGTEYDEIYLHNMWPDLQVDAQLSLTDRLHNRIQSFHDLIGLDSRLLSEAERLNADAMYRIYHQKELPELEDGLDEIAVNQRAISLLQRIQDDDPDLWRTIENLSDGIRSALQASAVVGNDPTVSSAQGSIAIDGSQMPLNSSSAESSSDKILVSSPFDDPKPGETLILLAADDVKGCYAVGSDLTPRVISPAQFIAAAECEPDTPTESLPNDTNARVMAAFNEFKHNLSKRLGKSRKRADTQNRRYLSKQLNIAREQSSDPQQITDLRKTFSGDLSLPVESALTDIRNLKLEGQVLVNRLQALRERYRLNPPDDSVGSDQHEPQIVRIVCSDGLK